MTGVGGFLLVSSSNADIIDQVMHHRSKVMCPSPDGFSCKRAELGTVTWIAEKWDENLAALRSANVFLRWSSSGGSPRSAKPFRGT